MSRSLVICVCYSALISIWVETETLTTLFCSPLILFIIFYVSRSFLFPWHFFSNHTYINLLTSAHFLFIVCMSINNDVNNRQTMKTNCEVENTFLQQKKCNVSNCDCKLPGYFKVFKNTNLYSFKVQSKHTSESD